MALGGGTFTVQNKLLPGTYINFVASSSASALLSDRGIAALPLPLGWGPEQQLFEVTADSLHRGSQQLLGDAYGAESIKPVREVLRHARTVYLFRLNSGGKKAGCEYAEAVHPGVRGNSLKLAVARQEGGGETARYDVSTYLGDVLVDVQRGVAQTQELTPNGFVVWKEAALQETAAVPLTGGEDGSVENGAYQEFLTQLEPRSFHAVGCPSADPAVTALFTEFARRMRDECGKKMQAVVFRTLADHEGVISVKNAAAGGAEEAALVPWVTGVAAGTAVNRSASNSAYDGEYEVDTAYTQAQLEQGLREGSFLLHRAGDEVRVLADNNTFVTATAEKSADFGSNQVIRVIDQIANDIALLFVEKYLGRIPNDQAGRISLWNDIVKHHQQLQELRAIEGFTGEDVTVEAGDTKKAVAVTARVTPVCAMEQLYMTVYVA